MSETSEGIPWFAANLRQAREAADLTQQELVRRVKCDTGRPFSQQTYSKIENGTQEPVLSVALSLARCLEADLAFLSQPPAEARAVLDIRNAVRMAENARVAAITAANQFRNWQEELRHLAAAAGPDSAGELAADALALTLDWEDD